MRHKSFLIISLIILFYLALHLVNLTGLPVFADEAIYTRWAQLIIDEPLRYLFFPLNDGKTPLFIWLQVPFQYFLSEPLYAARLVSVLVGLVQVGLVGLLLRQLKVRKMLIYFGMLLTTILPFWYMHHRLALMDGLLVVGISLAYLGVLRVVNNFGEAGWRNKRNISSVLLIALGFGLALWSKIPAILALPAMYLPILFVRQSKTRVTKFMAVTAGLAVGTLLFLLLIFTSVFGQLFSRGSDFLYPIQAVLFNNLWQETVVNIPSYINYFVQYLTPSLLLLIVIGLFIPKKKEQVHVLFWSGVLFCAPIVLLGKVVYPRYLFPATLFFTLAAVAAIDGIFSSWVNSAKSTVATLSKKQMIVVVAVGLLSANAVIGSIDFIGSHLINPDETPFVMADREQYLTKWSSGHGIPEVVEFITEASKNKTVAVATEGYFGTLPDGILIYFHDRDVSNLYIEGVGQPVSFLPDTFVNRAQEFDETWLVVNSHRLEMQLPESWLIKEYCRPFNAPCLQVWNVTDLTTSE